MNGLTEELKKSLQDYNQQLREKYKNQSNLNSKQLRNLISQKIGSFVNLNKLTKQELTKLITGKEIIGVDGSVNTVGKMYPHYITLLQALAKSTIKSKEGIVKHEVFSPVVDEDIKKIFKKKQEEEGLGVQEAASKIKSSLLASLEVQVAIESIKKWNPRLVMMDGSLIRYKKEAADNWDELVNVSLEKDVLLVGVIEEIGTHLLRDELNTELSKSMQKMYDRELLFGLLNQGEMLNINHNIKFKPRLQTIFLRTSGDPGVIGLDMLKEQREKLNLVANLVYTLTPRDSRGIPIWLDIVDEEVRISHKMMELLVDNYLDYDLKQLLFHSKRKDRVY